MKTRTTIIINHSIFKELKKAAIDQDKSFSLLCEEVFKNYLNEIKQKKTTDIDMFGD